MYSEDEVAKVFAEIIRRGGYEVDVFTNPILASEKIGSQHSIYLLVLTAWRMRRLSGIELGEQLSKIDPEIKIILISPKDRVYAQSMLGNPQTAGGFGGTDCENYLLTGIFDDYGINYFTTNETINRLIYLGKT